MIDRITSAHLIKYLILSVLVACVSGIAQNASAQTTLYVDSSRVASGSGTSWATAYKTLTEALMVANSSTGKYYINVAKGTYKPTTGTGAPTTSRDSSFRILRSQIKLYGGYPSGGGIRNITSNLSVLSGDIGIANDSSDNCYHIMTVVSKSSTDTIGRSVIFDGFLFTKGNANGVGNFVIKGQSIKRNYGGAVYLHGGDISFICSPLISYCSFIRNIAVNGGALYCAGYINGKSNPTIINSGFYNNNATNNGGAMYIDGHDYGRSDPSMYNVCFSCNRANNGGALYLDASQTGNSFPTITNCTFYNNSSFTNGNVIYSTGPINPVNGPTIKNSIMWGTPPLFYNLNTAVNITYSIVKGGYAGTGNISSDPLFCDSVNIAGPDNIYATADDGLHVQYGSPAVNVGMNTYMLSSIVTELAGYARIQGSVIDYGAYESPYVTCPLTTKLYVDKNIAASGAGTTWSTAFKTLAEALYVANFCSIIDSIFVAKGTYKPTAGSGLVTACRDTSFRINRDDIILMGGYPNGGGQRDLFTNHTILSGDIGLVNDSSDNCYHIMTITGFRSGDTIGAATVIDGFKFEKGYANDSAVFTLSGKSMKRNCGGVFYLYGKGGKCSPVIRNCSFFSNSAVLKGGVFYNDGTNSGNSSPNVVNCSFSRNISGKGTAVYNDGFSGASNPEFINCTFQNHSLLSDSSIIYNNGIIGNCNPAFSNCIIWGSTVPVFDNASISTINFSVVQGGFTGTGNSGADPLFRDPSAPAGPDAIFGTKDDGLYILHGSPAINSGNTSLLPAIIQTDVAGTFRRQWNIDMGAYESPFVTCPAQNKLYADSSRFVNGSGLAWDTAFQTVSEALYFADQCPLIDTICVAEGTYFPMTGNGMKTKCMDSSFRISRNNIKLLGGYPTGGGIRDFNANPVKLSPNIGSISSSADDCYHIMTMIPKVGIDSIGNGTVVDGFQFIDGNAQYGNPFVVNGQHLMSYYAGAIYMVSYGQGKNCSPTINNCKFISNFAWSYGGALYCFASNLGKCNPVINYCSFSGNEGYFLGGAMCNKGHNGVCSPVISHCSFDDNRSDYGGAISNRSDTSGICNPVIQSCTFKGNSVDVSGGAIFNNSFKGTCSPIYSNCIIRDNDASGWGGAIYNLTDTAGISNSQFNECEFYNNSGVNGGAVCSYSYAADCHLQFLNTFFHFNWASNDGGAVYGDKGCVHSFYQCKLDSNFSSGYGGAVFNDEATDPYLVDKCLFRWNQSTAHGSAIHNNGTCTIITNSVFSNNFTQGRGAVCNDGGDFRTIYSLITNCVFYNNVGWMGGNSVFNDSYNYGHTANTITNCTFYNSLGTTYEEILSSYLNSNAAINNCIVWGATPAIVSDYSAVTTVKNSVVTGGYAGTGNSGANPLFVNPADPMGLDSIWCTADDGLYFSVNSPAGNGGSNLLLPAGATQDITGGPRILQGIVDIGAYEGFCGFNISQSILISPGDSIIIGTHIYYTPGTYLDSLISSDGCDSILTTTISFSSEMSEGMQNTGKVRIFPNPNAGEFTIELSEISEVIIYNVFGDLLKSEILFEGRNQIDMRHLASGIYFVIIKSDKENTAIKVFKE